MAFHDAGQVQVNITQQTLLFILLLRNKRSYSFQYYATNAPSLCEYRTVMHEARNIEPAVHVWHRKSSYDLVWTLSSRSHEQHGLVILVERKSSGWALKRFDSRLRKV